MKKAGLATFGAVAACAACCAPLLVPLLWGGAAGAGGALFGLKADAVIGGAIVLAMLAVAAVWALRLRPTRAAAGGSASYCRAETCAPSQPLRDRSQQPAVEP